MNYSNTDIRLRRRSTPSPEFLERLKLIRTRSRKARTHEDKTQIFPCAATLSHTMKATN